MGTIHQHGRLEKNAAMWSSCRWMEVKMGRTFKEKTLTFKEVMQKIENDVNEAVVAGLAMTPSFENAGTDEWKNIASKFDPKEMPEVMRVVTVEGLDVNPCCGTHVKNLTKLRSLRVLNTEIARGAFRVWFVADNRVNREFTRMLKNEHAMTKLLSSAPNDHASRTEKMQRKNLKLSRKELAASIARDLVARSNEGVISYHRSEADLAFLQTLLVFLRDAKNNAVFVLTAGELAGDGLFLIAGPPEFINTHGRSVLSLIDGKGGGGKNGVIQGKTKWLSKVDILVAKLQELRLQQ
ncbi:hypothetical protein PsorP6_005334 [Peronosclerospora sorghi]|uniref:Uncharacterized protein n=1 Tax=Peronosclerospora sorghi TaxID=230839 RepID=A0ACC0W3Z0_9STRA|nr:hypothetical protein PsorP6_005334 [Peronosclerospora sorghi]